MARDLVTRQDGQPGHALLSFIACGVVQRRAAVLAAGGSRSGSAPAARSSRWAGTSRRRGG
jgi:hypothetical protein